MSLVNFSEADLRIMREVIAAVKDGRINTPNRPSTNEEMLTEQDYVTPDIYIAKPVDSSGIPAATSTVAGEADCNIYKIQLDAGSPDIKQLVGFQKKVYNFTEDEIDQQLLMVVRSSYGNWLAVTGGGDAPCDFIRFRIISADVVADPAVANVDILARPSGCSTVKEEVDITGTGETLFVYDKAGCFFNEPKEDLVDRIGHAKYLVDEADAANTGTGTADNPGDWEVVSLCCPSCVVTVTGTG